MKQKVSDFEAVDRYDIPTDPMSHLACDVAREERQYLAEVRRGERRERGREEEGEKRRGGKKGRRKGGRGMKYLMSYFFFFSCLSLKTIIKKFGKKIRN